ncbi:MAG: ABC transporter permease [Flavobacteriales bacterium]|nr:ABC transporter permease [Flavobacteriales bacterium]
MSVARFIANRILRSEDQERQDRLSRPIVLIAILGIMLGMAVMILTVSITRGFQREIRAKVLGVGGHLRITSIAQTDPKETPRMELDPELLAALGSLPQVHHVQSFATKPGIIETDEDIEERSCAVLEQTTTRPIWSPTWWRDPCYGWNPESAEMRS